MATSNYSGGEVPAPPFWRCRANLVGVVLAALTVVAHVAVGLGVLWPVVAAAPWGAGAALTPPEKPKQLPPPPAVLPVGELRSRLAHGS